MLVGKCKNTILTVNTNTIRLNFCTVSNLRLFHKQFSTMNYVPMKRFRTYSTPSILPLEAQETLVISPSLTYILHYLHGL